MRVPSEARLPRVCSIEILWDRHRQTQTHCTFFEQKTRNFKEENSLIYVMQIKSDCDRYLRISKHTF